MEMIKSAVKLSCASELNSKISEYIKVTCDTEGKLKGLSWLYDSSDTGLYAMAKRREGIWNRDAKYWTFPDSEITQGMYNAIIKRNPNWPVLGHPGKSFLPLVGMSISRLQLAEGLEACLTPSLLPSNTNIRGKVEPFRLCVGKGSKGKEIGLLLGHQDEIDDAVSSMVKQGATCDKKLAKKWPIQARRSKLHVRVTGWAVQVTCDPSNPYHFAMIPPQEYRWEGPYPYGVRVAVPWDGKIHTTRNRWEEVKSSILNADLEYEGDDPEEELSIPTNFDSSRVSGWDTTAPSGYMLHEYQKKGAQFCAERGMRALIGDEMGVGKTVQAIAAAEATGAPRVLIICPANARFVWDQEIKGWGAQGEVQHIFDKISTIDTAARWHILTYDLIVIRSETWRFCDNDEQNIFINKFPDLEKDIQQGKNKGEKARIRLTVPLDGNPPFDSKRVAAWEKMMRRLRGELLNQIVSLEPVLVILDEAHRVKNKTAKRTRAIQRITTGDTQMIMLTGTPLRNNEHEVVTLLSLLDDAAAVALSKKSCGYTIEDIKDYLAYFMIRRTKSEVLPELPEKTRQRINIDNLDREQMMIYANYLENGQQIYLESLAKGKTEGQARKNMQGWIEKARSALGVAKVLGGGVRDLVLSVYENKGCCVVFLAHHAVSDALKDQLEADGLRVAVVDGRTSQKKRAALVDDFQQGRLDIFIGGINSAGEAITLTRADTVIFAELDWVPAAIMQAEDRIHRVGQISNCQVIYMIAMMCDVMNLDQMMVDMIGDKMSRIGEVLGENGKNIIADMIINQPRT